MNRRRKVLIVVAACAVVALVVTAVWPREREPVYNGRWLSEWLEAGYFSYDGMPRQKALEAVRRIGTNALPYLLDRIRYQPSRTRQRVIALERRVPVVVSRLLRLYNLAQGSGERRAEIALFGFEALGADAAPAVPELDRLLRGTNSEISERAMSALGAIGKVGVGPLLGVVADPQRPDRGPAAYWLMRIARRVGGDPQIEVALVMGSLSDTNMRVRVEAMANLNSFKLEPGVCVPALVEVMRGTNVILRAEAVRFVERFGAGARSAVPVLAELLKDEDARVREGAKKALEKIAPEVLVGTNGVVNGASHAK